MSKGTVKTVSIDRGEARVRKLIAEMKRGGSGPHVKVGILESAGTEADGTKTVEVAIYNEFGADLKHGTIPERPAFRTAAKELMPVMKELGAQLLAKLIEGRTTVDHALDVLGLKAQAVTQRTIRDWTTPPNAASTILAKARAAGRSKISKAAKKAGTSKAEAAVASGYNNPLEDTGQLRNSVTYEKVK